MKYQWEYDFQLKLSIMKIIISQENKDGSNKDNTGLSR